MIELGSEGGFGEVWLSWGEGFGSVAIMERCD